MNVRHLARALLLSLCGTPLFAACGADDAVDRRIDCDTICDRYAECFDDDYDTEACANRCRDKAADDEDFEDKVDACESCIDDESCASGTFECTDNCLGIVP
jgi:hypothetical protein